MARSEFGASLADYGIDFTTGRPAASAAYQVWTAQAGGTLVTDLLDADGAPITGLTADDFGFIHFKGPDAHPGDLWLQGADSTPRLLIRPVDLTARVETAQATAEAAAAAFDPAFVATVNALNPATLIHRSDFQWNLLRNFGTGLGAGGDDTSEVQDFLNACSTAPDAVGIIPPAPAGSYLLTDTLTFPAYAQVEGPETAVRHYGWAPSAPPTVGALRLAPGSTATAILKPGASFTAGSLRNVALVGDNRFNASAAPVHGIWFDMPTTESALRAENVAIIGMSGDGVRGTLWAQQWRGLYVGGCRGYGINITGTDRATDVWVHGAILNGNLSGGINVDSTGPSGQFHVTGRTRIERSGWDPAASGLATGGTGAPGVRIRGNLQNSSFDVTTDANSGPGVSIVRVSGRSIHDIAVSGILSRDGWYDMTTGGTGQANPQAGLEIIGYSGGSVDYVDLTGLSIVGGKAKDDGTSPAYYHPAVGAKFDSVSFTTWPDVRIDPSIATEYTVGSGGLFRAHLNGRAGDTALMTVPVYAATTDRPGQTGKGAAILGMHGLDTSVTPAVPIWYDGATWVQGGSGGSSDPTKLPLAGGTLTGALTLSGAPTTALNAATKAYVDANAGGTTTAFVKDRTYLNARDYLFGDGRVESNTDVASLMAQWLATKKTLYFPAGTYAINAGQLVVPFNGATIVGDGIGPTVISKASDGILLDVSGTDKDTLRFNVTVRNITLYGADRTGALVRAYYSTLLYMERVLFSRNNGMGLDAVQLWDSTFVKCDWENVNSVTEYPITIRSSIAASGFGFSDDNSNALRFYGCRVELFKVGAISITRGHASGNNSHDITFAGLKCESSVARGSFIKVDANSNIVMFSQVYLFCGNWDTGYTGGAFPLVDWAPFGHSVLRDVFCGVNGNLVSAGVYLNGADDTVLDNVQGQYTVAPTSGYHVQVGSGVARLSARSILTNFGTYIGPAPVSYAPDPAGAAAIPVDDVAGTASLRTLGLGAQQAAGGNDPRIVGALQKAGGTMTGPLVLSGDPTSPLHPATKAYVDAGAGSGAVTKAYVDSGAFLNAKNYLKGDGTLETDASVTAMMTAWTPLKKTLYFPAGTYLINPGLLKFPFDGGIMRGDGRDATIIKRNANGILLDCSGTSDAAYRSMISYKDMRLHGGDKTGSMVRCYYTKHLKVRDVWHYGCNGPQLEGVALWDSYFDSVDFEWAWNTSTKAVVLRNSNAVSGFGFSADTTNALRFVGCRFETFAAGAMLIEAGTGSTSNPHDIILIACKMESAICNGGASGHFVDVAPTCDDIVINRLYTNVGGLGSGGTKVPSILRFKPAGNSSVTDAFLSSNGDYLDLGMEVSGNKTSIQRIRGKYAATPTSGNHVQITGSGASSDFSYRDVTTNLGTPVAGSPTSWAANPSAAAAIAAYPLPNPHALRAGEWHQTGLGPATPSNALGVGSARVAAYWFPAAAVINTVACEVTVAGETGALLRMVAYADDGSGATAGTPGKPGALIADFGTVAADSVTTPVKTITGLSQAIGGGGRWAWFGAIVQAVVTTQPTVRLVGTPSYEMAFGTATPTALSQAYCGYSMTGVTGAAPSTYSTTPTLAGTVARIAFKVN